VLSGLDLQMNLSAADSDVWHAHEIFCSLRNEQAERSWNNMQIRTASNFVSVIAFVEIVWYMVLVFQTMTDNSVCIHHRN
jgi:hypothetical protein